MSGTVLGITSQHKQYANNAYVKGVYSPGRDKKETDNYKTMP